MKKIKLFVMAFLLLSPLSVFAEESLEQPPFDVSSQFFDFSIDDFKVISGDQAPLLVFTGDFKNIQNSANEPEFDFEFSTILKQGSSIGSAKELKLAKKVDFDDQLIENGRNDIEANETIKVAFAYELIDDSHVFIQDKGFLFSSDGSEFSYEIDPYDYDTDSILVAKPLEERIYEASEDAFGNRLISASISENGYVAIDAQIADNFSNSWIRDGFEMSIQEVLEKIQPYDFQSVTFTGYFDMVDQYGNVENDSVFIMEIVKDEIDKINFTNFNYNNLKNLADAYSWHPAFLD